MVPHITYIVGLICVIAGFLIGIYYSKKTEKSSGGVIGVLLIDKIHPEVNGGVYSQFFVDPKTFTDGQRIEMDVLLIKEDITQNSQQEQGS